MRRSVKKFNHEKEQPRDRQKMPSSESEINRKDLWFWLSVIFSQAAGLTCVGLVVYWMTLYKGFAWNSDANLQFNYHPFFMVLGLIFLYGDAIIVYRVFAFLPKWILKGIHALLHVGAVSLSSVALVAVLENHRRTNKADFYSLHSWIGIATFGLFCVQYVEGFVVFLWPGLPNNWRAKYMPYHRFFGIGIFLMAVATALMGITEKLLWTKDYTSGKTIPEGMAGNVLGLFLIVFAFTIVFLASHSAYKRRPLPEELPSKNVA